MGVMVRIASLIRAPLALQGGKFSRITRPLRFRRVTAPAFGLVMDQRCTRFVKALPASLVELQTKIHVVESYGKVILVEAADGEELLLRDNQASSGDRADPLRQASSIKVACFVMPQISMRMP